MRNDHDEGKAVFFHYKHPILFCILPLGQILQARRIRDALQRDREGDAVARHVDLHGAHQPLQQARRQRAGHHGGEHDLLRLFDSQAVQGLLLRGALAEGGGQGMDAVFVEVSQVGVAVFPLGNRNQIIQHTAPLF